MQRSIDEQLFSWPDATPRLVGGECRQCGIINFPRQSTCPRCCSAAVEPRRLGTVGRLWTWTTQGFAPKSPPYAVSRDPKAFVPYRLGYIELPGEVIVESRIEADDALRLTIGMPMQLIFAPLFTDAAGDEVISFAFTPAVHS